MALELHIHPGIHNPARPLHPPPPDKSLRIQIQGPLESIQKLLPDVSWHTKNFITSFPQPAGPRLASLTYQKRYGQEVRPGVNSDVVVRDEYLDWVMEERRPLE
jgi:hypothetical protein